MPDDAVMGDGAASSSGASAKSASAGISPSSPSKRNSEVLRKIAQAVQKHSGGADVMASVEELQEILQLSDPPTEALVCGPDSKRARADDGPRGLPLRLTSVVEEAEQRAEAQQQEEVND